MRALVDFNRSHILTELDRHADAFKLLESVAERYERAGQHLFAWQARFHMAYIDFLRGNYNRALAAYYQARERLAAMGSAILVAWCNQEIAEILLALNAFDDASESALADLLARYLRDSASAVEGPATDQRARLLKLIEDLNWYSSHARLEDEKGDQRRARVSINYLREAKACEREIARLFRRMESDDPRLSEIGRMQSASAEDLCAALEPDETAVEYFTTGDRISAFIASRGRFEVVRDVASKREVEQLNAATNRHLIKLYEMAFSAVEPRLIVIPHGPLHYVPFHALLDRRGYVIDRCEISYAPSATVLKLCRDTSEISNLKFEISDKLVALGVAGSDTPSIEAEVRALGRIFPEAVTLTGERATRDNLMRYAPQARFLHLASHGYFRRDNPMFSFLQLADSPLNFYSLLDLRLKAEMVTLSACHTGVNTVFPGDELHGLMRGFLYAGAPSLVASL